MSKNVNIRKVFSWSIFICSVVVFSWQVTKSIKQPGADFDSYYVAAHLILNGENISKIYDDEWFRKEVNKHREGYNTIFDANLPTTAIALLPLGFGSENTARLVWLIINIVLLIYIIKETTSISRMSEIARPLWYSAVLLSQPVTTNLYQGQAYLVITAGLIWLYHCVLGKRENKAGLILAFLFMFKTAGTMLWPYFVIQKRWKLLLVAVLTIAITLLATFPLIGFEGWEAYFERAAQKMQSPYKSVTAYQTIESWFQHMFSPHPVTQTKPIIALPLAWAHGMTVGLVVLLLSLSILATHKFPKAIELHLATFILLIPTCVPVTLIHAYSITLIPIAILLKAVCETSMVKERVLVFTGTILILLPLPFKSSGLFDGYLSLLAYPKLYGALILWAISMWLLTRGVSLNLSQFSADIGVGETENRYKKLEAR
ncbi:glycosyltransferase family 87 protein [Aliikangiella sp. IMCC44359]|uniref:glycosyltransferase family 87 protein n=1 Tax=Aliikangiella sp. IMCC44359 TaxID=3459125 RepID=UPI00403A7C94